MDNLYEMIKKADAGDVEAQSKAAHHILHELDLGENDKEIIAKAFDYLRNAAMSASYYGFAALELGEEYYSGRYIAKNYQQAVMWFRTAIQQEQPIGYYRLGKCFLCGHGVGQDYAKAFDSFLKGSLRGYINNSIRIGDMFKEGVFVDCDPEYAAKLYHHVFDTELDLYKKTNFWSDAYGQICLRLGECYLHGLGVAKDIEEANYFFAEAKEHSDGVHWLSDEKLSLLQLMYDAPYDDIPDTPIDSKFTEEISEADFISLMTQKLPTYNLSYYPEKELHDLCALNPSITKFDDMSFCDIYEGVKADNPRKMYEMAIICFQGDKNCPKNPLLKDYGIYLFHKSLLGGCTNPLEILGLCYYHGGDGVEQSYEIALFLYGLSRYPMAYGEIGVCYANGKGVERDYMAAYVNFAKCLLLDRERAGKTYENLTIIYPHLKCFEQDQSFVDFCHRASEKYESDDYDSF